MILSFTRKNRLRYSRERAVQNLSNVGKFLMLQFGEFRSENAFFDVFVAKMHARSDVLWHRLGSRESLSNRWYRRLDPDAMAAFPASNPHSENM